MEIRPRMRPSRRRHRRPRRRLLVVAALLIPGVAGVALASWDGGQPAKNAATSSVADSLNLPTATAVPLSPTPSQDPTATASVSESASAPPAASPSSAAASRPADAPAKSSKSAAQSQPAKSSADAGGQGGSGSSGSSASSSGDAAQRVLDQINKARADQGLAALTLLDGLNSSALLHSQAMSAGCGLSHQCSGEAAVGQRETAQGVRWSSAGENIGTGGPAKNATAVGDMAVKLTQDMLAERPPNDGHRRNILSTSFTRIGISVIQDGSGTVWMTQDFSG
ncbi:CAP domain-containing protein [Kitasatospora sp. NPDC048540]|uniref:CAP domain-containing protein n=1 Tax=Kitasatospora sp. NPDC048540 TaxID=3155634 RepID=UPI0033D6A604